MTAPWSPGFSSLYSFFFRPTRPGGDGRTLCRGFLSPKLCQAWSGLTLRAFGMRNPCSECCAAQALADVEEGLPATPERAQTYVPWLAQAWHTVTAAQRGGAKVHGAVASMRANVSASQAWQPWAGQLRGGTLFVNTRFKVYFRDSTLRSAQKTLPEILYKH